MSVTYVPEHARNVAISMAKRYGGKIAAMRVCRNYILSPHTEPAGQIFWKMVENVLREDGSDGAVGSPAQSL